MRFIGHLVLCIAASLTFGVQISPCHGHGHFAAMEFQQKPHFVDGLHSPEAHVGNPLLALVIVDKDLPVISKEELSRHHSKSESIYLSVLGQVFDVTEAKKHYGQQGGYAFFCGKDATRAFVTGDFKKDLNDEVADLSDGKKIGIMEWVQMYRNTYPLVAKLEGTFYNHEGKPTNQLLEFEAVVEKVDSAKKSKQTEEEKWPPCNSEWSQARGSRVWCSKQSGGISRDWIGVPRLRHTPASKVPHCVCAHESRLSDPSLKLYPKCDPQSISCSIASS